MPRVVVTDVRAIMESTTATDAVINVFITSANALVNQVFGDSNVSTIATEIERWLTAHMIAISIERQAAKEGAGGATIEYAGNWDKFLDMTSFGQMVKSLDVTGQMAVLGKAALRTFAIPGV
jgi:hypothetical protein